MYSTLISFHLKISMSHKFLWDLIAIKCCRDNSTLISSNCSHKNPHTVLKPFNGIYEHAANKFATKLYIMNNGTYIRPSIVGWIKNLIISVIPDSLRSNNSFTSFILILLVFRSFRSPTSHL